jgi:hypothetical protein
MTTATSRRDGVALFAAVSLMAFLGLLIIAAVAASSMSQHATHLSLTDAPLLAADDYALGEVLTNPLAFGLADLELQRGRRFDIPLPSSYAGLNARLSATRLPSGIFWIVAESRANDADGARRRVAMLARTAWIGPPPASSFVARGSTALDADVIVLADTTGEPDCAIRSAPAAVQTADSSTLFSSSGQWEGLAAAPGVRVASGDTTLTAGAFEGILMVGGNLTVSGALEASGLIVARGRIRSTAGFHLTGAMISQSDAAGAIELHGATVRYAPCLVASLLRRASPVRALRGWGWTELF